MVSSNGAYEGMPPQQEERHLLDYWYVILRQRRLVAAVALAVVAAAALHAFLTRPAYQGVVQILIEPETPNVLAFKEVADVEKARDDYYQTQYKLLQNRALARKVIEELKLLQDPEFGGPRSVEEVQAVQTAAPGASPLMERGIDSFVRKLGVQAIKNSRLVMLSFEAHRPELAAQVANKLAQLYIGQTLEFRYQTSAEAGQWLGGQVDGQRKKVEAAEIALQKFKEVTGTVNIEERRGLLDQRFKDLGAAYDAIKTQRLQREALYRQMRAASNPEELPDVIRDPLIQSLQVTLAALRQQEAQLVQRYLDQHPEVIKVRNQATETQQKIKAEAQRVIRAAENDYKAAAAQEASVASALDEAKAEALDLSQRGVQYDSLKREVEANKEVLNSLLSRLKQTDVAQELKSSNIRIVDPASIPRAPIRPRPLRDILLGTVVGLALSVGLVFFLEYLDNTLKTPEDVRVHLRAPLLAVIPEIATPAPAKERVNLVLLNNTFQEGPFGEGYRLLRTALTYSWPEQRSRVVAITSTIPGEGKTISSVNLALTLASMHGKVLLIDADLRKPQAHAALRVKRSPGLSDILVGKVQPSEAIQNPAGSTLNVIGAGSPAPSPADLMSEGVFKALLEGLRGVYDWIVIDTPPVAVVSEMLVLAPLTDGVVILAGAEMVPRKAVAHTMERVASTGARVLGIVLNRTQVERHSYYYRHYYGYYYKDYKGYYGHGYGYGQHHTQEATDQKVESIRSARGAKHG